VDEGEAGLAEKSKWIPRQTEEEFKLLCKKDFKGNYVIPDADSNTGNSKILRPQSKMNDDSSFLSDLVVDDDDNFIVSKNRFLGCINGLVQEHTEMSTCTAPNFVTSKVIKKGVTSRMSFKCTNCAFISSIYQLYNEIPKTGRGCKPAAVNVGLQVGLQETAIGNTKLRVILSGGNIYSPSSSSMQKLANSVTEKTIDLNKTDMHKRLSHLREIQELRAVSSPDTINISFDGRYNSFSYGSRHKMGQSCSQAVGVAREATTLLKDGWHIR
jgi:hypothetical protein